MFKKSLAIWLAAVGFLLLSAAGVQAQSPAITAGMSTTIAATGSGIGSSTVGFHRITWSVSGKITACTVAIDSSSDNSSWTAGGAVPNQNCTNSGDSGNFSFTSAYIRIDVSTLTGGGTLNVSYTGTSGGGSGTGGGAAVINCSAFSGGNVGAQYNACLSGLPSGAVIVDARGIVAGTLSTAVTISTANTILEICPGTGGITQTAAITISGTGSGILSSAGCGPLTKGANIDQITLTGASESVQYVNLNGVRATYTGNGIVASGTSSAGLIAWNTIKSESTDAIQLNGAANVVGGNAEGNTISDVGARGISAFDSLANAKILDNSITLATTSTGDGIFLANPMANFEFPQNILVRGNQIYNQSTSSNCINNQDGFLDIFDHNTCSLIGNSKGAYAENIGGAFFGGSGTWTSNLATNYYNGAFSTITDPFFDMYGDDTVVGNNIYGKNASGIEFLLTQGTISNNQVTLEPNTSVGLAAIFITCSSGALTIGNNYINVTTGAGATNDTYGILVESTVASSTCTDVTITGNTFLGSATNNTHIIAYAALNPMGTQATTFTNIQFNNNDAYNVNKEFLIGANVGPINLANNVAGGATTKYSINASAVVNLVDNTGYSFAFAGVPPCTSATTGTTIQISDSTTTTWGATIAGSSTNAVTGHCDGSVYTVVAK